MVNMSFFSANDFILIMLAAMISMGRLMGFAICKIQHQPMKAINLGALLKHQPWLPALLILLCFSGAYFFNQSAIIPQDAKLYFLVSIALSLIKAVFILMLFLAEAKAIAIWLEGLTQGHALWQELLPNIKKALLYIFLILALPFIMPSFQEYPQVSGLIDKVTSVLVIWTVAWLIIQMINALEKVAIQHFSAPITNNFRARSIYTQARVFKRIASLIIVVLAFAVTAMVFDNIRELGTSILASAGLATVILGFAAQKTLGNLFVGIQIALTQPMRLNDTIILENELGTVEEISLSHVVLRIWDLRRLIIPINYFIEKPFQNLSRTSTNLLCPIFFHADYNLPVELVRAEFLKIVAASKFWDGGIAKLQVIEAQSNVIKLRALASVKDAGDSWDLKCEVLEKLTHFITQNFPQSLPKVRNLSEEEFISSTAQSPCA